MSNTSPFKTALESFDHGLPEQETKRPEFQPDFPVSQHIIDQTDAADMPYIDAQVFLEKMFDKNQQMKRIKSEFDIDMFHRMCREANMPVDFCLDLVTQMAIHKRASASVLIGILYPHFQYHGVSRQQAMQQCADALEAAIENDFVDFIIDRDEFVQKLVLMPDAIQDVDRYQYPLPMVVQPRACAHNRSNGHISRLSSKSLVVLQGEKAGGHYETADVCLDHLDRVNRVPLALNQEVVELIDNEWADLDQRRRGETFEDFQKRRKAFDRYDRASKDVVNSLVNLRDRFWLTHKYDRRGRVYCQGYHVTYQGNPWNKACIEFANKELVS